MSATTTAARAQGALALVLLLRDIPLFKGLSADELLPIAGIATRTAHDEGAVVFEEGSHGAHLYVIAEGRVEVLRGGERLALLGPGDCFGEMALLDQSVRSASVRVVEAAALVTIARDDFDDLLEVYPAIARAIALVLAGRLREAYQK
jgi:CRP-like cAMP-binding protein